MRKVFAVVLAVLQLAFGGFLIANGGKADRAKEERIDEILAKGTEFLFSLDNFEYSEDIYAVSPLYFGLHYPNLDYAYDYYPLTANENGVALYGESTPTPPAEPYLKPFTGVFYFRLDQKSLHELFKNDLEGSDTKYYSRFWLTPDKNKFNVNGHWGPVYAIGTVYGGDLVFTGIMVNGERY